MFMKRIVTTVLSCLLCGAAPSFAQVRPNAPATRPAPVATPPATVRPSLSDTTATIPAATVAVDSRTAAPPAAPPSAYPAGWDVQVPERTNLEKIKALYERRRVRLAATDLQDQSPLPMWFRAYLRDNLPELPRSGKYQYPRVAAQILQWMVAHPDLAAPPPTPPAAARSVVRTMTIGHNINLTNFDERNSESFIAQDYNAPEFLIAGSNNITGSGRQKQFFSKDGGATWGSTELPLAQGTAFHSDPALAFTSDGTAWAAALGIDNLGTKLSVQVFRSADRGETWAYVADVSTGNNNDKEMMAIDSNPASPFRDNIYIAWDVPGRGMRFTRSADKGATWQPVTELSTDVAIGTHLAVGPSGEVYVAWPDVDSRELRFRKSTDGGASFGPVGVIARSNSSYEVSIPSMCQRKVLVYLSVGVDKSDGPRRGTVYATWTDRDGTASDPGCAGTTTASNANVYFSASRDGGGTWSAPRVVHANPPNSDQFNQWMDVDIEDGTIHVTFYDTRDDPGRRKTHLYYINSKDGGATWANETRITNEQSDETADGSDAGNQYGDYNGLVAHRNVAFPTWTDRRPSNPGAKEQIFTASVRPAPEGTGGPTEVSVTDPTVATASPGTRAARLTRQPQGEGGASSYPQAWDVPVPAGTKLARLKRSLERQRSILPERDAEDRTPIPVWFRVFFRKRNKDLPTSGPYQYPRIASRLLQFYVANPDSVPTN